MCVLYMHVERFSVLQWSLSTNIKLIIGLHQKYNEIWKKTAHYLAEHCVSAEFKNIRNRSHWIILENVWCWEFTQKERLKQLIWKNKLCKELWLKKKLKEPHFEVRNEVLDLKKERKRFTDKLHTKIMVLQLHF